MNEKVLGESTTEKMAGNVLVQQTTFPTVLSVIYIP